MNRSYFSLLMVLVILVLVYRMNFNKKNEAGLLAGNLVPLNTQRSADIAGLISKRVKTNSFDTIKPDDSKIQTLILTALGGGTDSDNDTREFIVIRDENSLNKFYALPIAHQLPKSTCIIVVCGMIPPQPSEFDHLLLMTDCARSVQNLILSAKAMDIDSYEINLSHPDFQVEELNKLLSLPDYIKPCYLIILGYSKNMSFPKNYSVSEKLHWESW